jgi:heme exporter protein A
VPHPSSHRVNPTTPIQPPALELRAAARRFGRRWALRGVTLRIEPGEAVAVTGDNGSGKSTLLRVAATAVTLTSGDGSVFGHDLRTEAGAIRGIVALLGHSPGVYEDLTVRENLEFVARMLAAPDPDSAADAALEAIGLTRHRGDRVRTLSSGWQRRVALARVWMQRPRLLLLDEPYNSFDPGGIALVNSLIESTRARGGATLVVTHTMPAGAAPLDREVQLVAGVTRDRAAHAATAAAHSAFATA